MNVFVGGKKKLASNNVARVPSWVEDLKLNLVVELCADFFFLPVPRQSR